MFTNCVPLVYVSFPFVDRTSSVMSRAVACCKGCGQWVCDCTCNCIEGCGDLVKACGRCTINCPRNTKNCGIDCFNCCYNKCLDCYEAGREGRLNPPYVRYLFWYCSAMQETLCVVSLCVCLKGCFSSHIHSVALGKIQAILVEKAALGISRR